MSELLTISFVALAGFWSASGFFFPFLSCREDVESLRQTIRAAMRLDYPAHLLHIIVGDDGFFPTSKMVERSDMGLRMYQTCVEEAGYDPLVEETMNEHGTFFGGIPWFVLGVSASVGGAWLAAD